MKIEISKRVARALLTIVYSWDGHVSEGARNQFGDPSDMDIAFGREALEEAAELERCQG